MRISPVLFIATLVIGGAADAAKPHVSIFRKPESLFASGQLPLTDLDQRRANYAVHQWQQVKYKDHTFWIPEERFLSPIELSKKVRVTTDTLLLKSPYAFSKSVSKLIAGAELKALNYQDDWVQIYTPNSDKRNGPGEVGWIPLFFVEPIENDKGYIYTKYNSYLFSLPSGHSKVVRTIPIATKLEPLDWDNEWARVQWGDHLGYVPLNHVITRFHFAKKAKVKDQWLDLDTSAFPKMKVAGKTPVGIKDVVALKSTPSQTGTVLTDSLKGYAEPSFQAAVVPIPGSAVGSPAELLQYQYQTWVMSLSLSHGPVWWNSDESKKSVLTEREKYYATEQILKKPLHEAATHPQAPNTVLISAEGGLFLTTDGRYWKRLEALGTEKAPVAIDAKGRLYVGDQVSQDGGKSFKPYIRWDSLTAQIVKKMGAAPSKISIEKIILEKESSLVKIKLGVDKKVLAAVGVPLKDSWSLTF